MAEADPREGGAPILPSWWSEDHALQTATAVLDPSLVLFETFRDAGRPAPVREAAFAKFLVTPGPTWDGMKPIEWARARARAQVRLLARDNWSARNLEPDAIANEAAMKLISGCDTINSPASYLFATIRNIATWQMKDEWQRAAELDELDDSIPERAGSLTETEAESLAFWDAAGRGINALRPRLRAVAVLHLLEHLPLVEVAARLGVPAATVRKRWERVKAALMLPAKRS